MAQSARSDRSAITALLLEIRSLDAEPARNRLFDAAYAELRRLAHDIMRGERADHTLRPTALVHEAFIRMVEVDGLTWEGRAHFFGIAARAMRQILVDHARSKGALKRGGARTRVTLNDNLRVAASEPELLVLDDALEGLARLDARAAKVAELRVFAGMTAKEIAHVLGVSLRTAQGDWTTARMWLSRALAGGPA